MNNDKKETLIVTNGNGSKIPVFTAIFFIFLSLFLFQLTGFSHSGKARYHVIIDTDGALDDLRTLCLFMASTDFEILAITTSDGVLNPSQTVQKVRSLLACFGHEGIPVGQGTELLKNVPPWRTLNRSISWTNNEKETISFSPVPYHPKHQNALDTIRDAMLNEKEPVLFICLGSLANLASAITTSPDLMEGIKKVVWYVDNIDPLTGTNYEFNREAANTVLKSPLHLDAVSNRGNHSTTLDTVFLNNLLSLDSPYSKMIASSHSSPEVSRLIDEGHLRFWDDLLPVYLLYPDNFFSHPLDQSPHIQQVRIKDWDDFKNNYGLILTDRNQVKSKVFEGFPEDKALFARDIRPVMAEIIRNHGREEWRLGVLTNELHGHLGIYAVIGTKMGLRAREYFHIGIDDISVISHAGKNPPLSCMNDGLQVSTGGTVGHGLFTVKAAPPYLPQASFTFKNRTIRIILKNSFWSLIKDDIRNAVQRFGLGTDLYWQHIRKLAIGYWLNWSRRDIFRISRNP